jgi:hypothetical protein
VAARISSWRLNLSHISIFGAKIYHSTANSLIVSILASMFNKKEIHAKENNFTVPNFARTFDIVKRKARMDLVNTFTFSVES